MSIPTINYAITELKNRILKQGGDKLFYSFANTEGKRWLMPRQNMVTALCLYQPLSINGKLIKELLPYLHWIGLLRSRLGIDSQYYELCDELKIKLCKLFQKSDIEFSVFCGTPSAHQKITLQISSGKKILGYCKVTDNEEIKKIFKHEQQLLNALKQQGVRQIPECLYCDTLKENIDLFVQTTVKTNKSVTIHQINKQHWNFLNHLHLQTRQTLSFEQTDFYHTLKQLSNNLKQLTPADAEIVINGISKVRQQFDGQEVIFSAYHADFTPWNMFVEKGELFVFDFEYAQMTYPPYLDWFHFFTQSGIFEKHLDAEQLFSDYQKQKAAICNYFANPDFSYQCYLLSVIALYLDREDEHPEPNIMSMLKIWVTLLSILQNATEK